MTQSGRTGGRGIAILLCGRNRGAPLQESAPAKQTDGSVDTGPGQKEKDNSDIMRKLMILMAAIAALGVMAISASAASAVTFKEGSTTLAVGAKVTGTSSNTKTVTSVGTLECSLVTLNSLVQTNSASPAVLTQSGAAASTATGCKVGSNTVTITEIKFEPIKFNAGGTNESKNIKFVYDVSGVASGCFLEGPATSKWTNGSSTITISANLTGGGGGLCPTSGTLSGTFNLETTGTTTAVTVNN